MINPKVSVIIPVYGAEAFLAGLHCFPARADASGH